jgi:vacuolar-type H+-ATPase subunit I/STV1
MNMNNDKAIIKALHSTESSKLPDDFNSQLMTRIYRAAERRKKRTYILSLCLVSGVSLLLIAMTIYLLNNYFTFNLSLHLPKLNVNAQSITVYGFSFYIAVLTLILIGLDHYFRHKWMIKKSDNNRV